MMTNQYQAVKRASAALIAAILLLSARPVLAQSYTLAPPPFLYVFATSGAIVPNGCVWTYAAGTTTPIATYSDSSGTPNGNPIIADTFGRFVAYLVPGTNYKFVYEMTPCSSPSTHGATIKTQDNIQGSPASAANVDIVGTAGEAISAGNAVYLSDGSGGKVAGQWYKADSGNAYSSVTPPIGMAPNAIVAATTGTIRLQGQVTGLSSLVVGSTYYLGAAGAIVVSGATPTFRRAVGVADSTSSLVLASWQIQTPAANNGQAQGRLTLTSGLPVTFNDVSAAGTVYYTPYTGNVISLYDGTAIWTPRTFIEQSIVLSGLVNAQAYDVFAFDNAGTVALETAEWANTTITMTIAAPCVVTWTSHGMATGSSITFTTTGALPTGITANTQYWITSTGANTFNLSTSPANVAAGTLITTSGTQSGTHTGHQPQARQTALALQNGVYVKTGVTTRRYLGTFLTTSTSATEDSATKRYLWNYYNRVSRQFFKQDSTTSWNYTLAAFRQADGSAANQIEFVVGVQEAPIDLRLSVMFTNGTGNTQVAFGFGLDSTNTAHAQGIGGYGFSPPTTQTGIQGVALLTNIFPAIGRHFIAWLESSAALGTTTWYGSASATGLVGSIQG